MTDCTCQPYWPGDDARHLCTCGGRRHRPTEEAIKAEAMDRAFATEEFQPRARAVLVEVLVYHYRKGIEGCGCGWAVLGASHAEHVADVYEQSMAASANGEGIAE